MIGAGSVVFSKNLAGDLLSHPEFRNATLSYMDVDAERLAVGVALCRKVARSLGAAPAIQAHTDRRAALDGADFVINMVQVGGFDSTLVDFEIPRRYGLNFTIADTTGPGGMFRALRTFPVLAGLCHDIQEVCPRATLLNYANPMGMNMQTVARTSAVRAVGLCHSVQGTFEQLTRYLGEDPAAVTFTCAGINHMAFYLRLEKDGQDLYPRLFEAMNRPEVYDSNRVRFELMKRLGYFVTESSEHSAEYCPYFIPHGPEVVARYAVPIDEYLRRCDNIVDEFERMKRVAATDAPLEHRRTHEYGPAVIHSMATGAPSVVYANAPNRGSIANLPDDAIVEVATVVDRAGPRATTVGALPPQLVAYMSPHLAQQELFIRAATEGRRDHVYQAALFDPLTAAVLPPDRIVEMCDELIAAHGFLDSGGLLPRLDARPTLVPTSGKTFTKINPRDLRDAWCTARQRSAEDYLPEWHVIGPFPSLRPDHVSLDLDTPVERDLVRLDGEVDLSTTYPGRPEPLVWRRASACRRTGCVDLAAVLGPHEFCAAYAVTKVDSPRDREAVLRFGSDDGLRVWVNGQVVHSNDAQRGYAPDTDTALTSLKAGPNTIVVKITNHRYGWAFGVAVPPAAF